MTLFKTPPEHQHIAFAMTWTQLGIKCYFWLELDVVQLLFVQWRIAEGLVQMMGTLCVVGLESELTWLVDLEDRVCSVHLECFKCLKYQETGYNCTGCFKKSFTTLKAYRNLYRGHTQCFELSKFSKTHRVLPRIVIRNCFDLRQVGALPHYQWKSHWAITIRGKTLCVLLHFDSSKHCLCSLYAFKVVSYLGEVCEYLNTRFPGWWTVTVEVPWRRNREKRSKQLRITILSRTRCVLLYFDSSKRCVCPLYKFLYAFKVVKLFLKHSV
jgi:hypothetical protein